jgi:hypothetical protein
MTVGSLAIGHVHGTGGHVVVPVSAITRRRGFEEGLEVSQQLRLMLVDHHSSCRVHRLDVEDAEAEAGVGNKPLEAVGQVDELSRLSGRDVNSGEAAGRRPSRSRASARQDGCERFHSKSSTGKHRRGGGRESSAMREHLVRCS